MAIIKSPIFKDITESEISVMTAAGFLRARKFRKNSFIYHVTDSVHEIGIVASGQVTIEYIDLWGNKAIMSNITPGHNGMSLLDYRPRKCDLKLDKSYHTKFRSATNRN